MSASATASTAAGDGPKVDAIFESGERRLPGRPVTRQCSERARRWLRKKWALGACGFQPYQCAFAACQPACLVLQLAIEKSGGGGGNGWAPQSLLGYRRFRFLRIQQKKVKRGTSAFDAAAAAAVRQLSYSELVSDAETETKRRLNRPD